MRRFIAIVLVIGAMASAGSAAASELLRQTLASAALQRDMPYLVYLPDDYQAGNHHYPVLYLLHGAGGDENVWTDRAGIQERTDRLIASGEIPPAIIIMPGCQGCWWVDGAKDKAETAFWSELVPAVDQRLRTLATKSGRLIAGVSAGGYGAVRFALKYPERVGAVAALSPAVYAVTPPARSSARRDPPFLRADGQFNQALWAAENYPRLAQRYFEQPGRVPFYLVSGNRDELGIAFETTQLFNTIAEWQPELTQVRIVDGRHDWNVWNETLDDAMKFVFRVVPRSHASTLTSVSPLR